MQIDPGSFDRRGRCQSIESFLRLILAIVVQVGSIAIGPAEGSGRILHLAVEDAITPVTSRFIVEGIAVGEREQAEGVVIQLDTPGGLDTSMREATKAILGSTVPVIVWVGPSGARAASAGMFLTLAAHVAAMAPGTNIGAAHPVGIGGGMSPVDSTMASKVLNDAAAYARSIAALRGRNAEWAERAVRQSVSLEAEEAVRQGVCDLIASDLQDLLLQIDGRGVQTAGGVDTLRTAGIEVQEYRMGFRERLLAILVNPNIAYLLFLAGILGIFFELSNPGVILPGVIGGISLILALFAFQNLPVNYAGVMLILLALVLFIVEIKVPSHGALTIGGILSLLLGSLMLFRTRGGTMNVSLGVIVPALVITAAFFVLAVTLAIRAQKRRPVTGVEGMVGEIGTVFDALAPEGRILFRGEYWMASAATPLPRGTRVRIVSVKGLHLEVMAIEGGGSAREG